VSDLLAQPIQLFSTVLFSRRASLEQTSEAEWPRALLVITFFGWPALAGLAVVSQPLVSLIFGDKWQGAAPLIAALALGRAVNFPAVVIAPLMVAQNQQRLVLRLQFVCSGAAFLALLLMVRWGGVAAALTLAAGAAVNSGAQLWLQLRDSGVARQGLGQAIVPVLTATLLTPIAAALPLHLAPAAWPQTLNLALSIGAGVLAWLVIAVMFRNLLATGIRTLTAKA
jgi:O-antigen/teichoic acid export membrane protein